MKDILGITHYSNGATSNTDALGITHYSDPSGLNGTSSTDFLGNTHYDFSNGTSGTISTDMLGIAHVNDNSGNSGTAYTDGLGITHNSGDFFLTNNCPVNSTYDPLSKKCKCNTGYVASGSSCIYQPQSIKYFLHQP